MRAEVQELLFTSRGAFRAWLSENAESSDGVWLVFSKMKERKTLSANDALEEAICFGWIDGQMKSIDSSKYKKYFSRRHPKSVWSEKNKTTAEILRQKGLLTESGAKAVETAKLNGTWDVAKHEAFTDDQLIAFVEKLAGRSPAYENYKKMPPSVQRTYLRRYLSFKTEDARQRDFERIVERLNENLKPM